MMANYCYDIPHFLFVIAFMIIVELTTFCCHGDRANRHSIIVRQIFCKLVSTHACVYKYLYLLHMSRCVYAHQTDWFKVCFTYIRAQLFYYGFVLTFRTYSKGRRVLNKAGSKWNEKAPGHWYSTSTLSPL